MADTYYDYMDDEETVYSEDYLNELIEEDSISSGEYGFMVGYLREDEQGE